MQNGNSKFAFSVIHVYTVYTCCHEEITFVYNLSHKCNPSENPGYRHALGLVQGTVLLFDYTPQLVIISVCSI